MKTKKIIAHILVSFFFLQCSYAQETSEYITTKKTVVENKVNIHLREVPGIFGDRIATVSEGVLGTLTGKEVKRDNMTWVEIVYSGETHGWVHKSLLSLHAQSYETQVGKVYTVYYGLSEKEKAIFGADGETASGTTEEIIWITTDLRISLENKTDYSWTKKKEEVAQEDTTTTEQEVESINTIQDYDLRAEEAFKYNIPWVVTKEVGEVIVSDQETIAEVPVMLTSDFRTDTQIKFQGPWANKEAFEFTGSTDTALEEDTTTNTMQDFSLRTEVVSYNVPWAKAQTGAVLSQTGSEEIVEVQKPSSITSTINEEIKKYFLGPWAEKEAFEFTNSGSSDETIVEETVTPADITTTFTEEVKTRDLYTFIFGK